VTILQHVLLKSEHQAAEIVETDTS